MCGNCRGRKRHSLLAMFNSPSYWAARDRHASTRLSCIHAVLHARRAALKVTRALWQIGWISQWRACHTRSQINNNIRGYLGDLEVMSSRAIQPSTAASGQADHPSSIEHPVSTLTRPDPSIAANNRTTIHSQTPTPSKPIPPQHRHKNGRPHALRAPQRSFHPPCHQLRPDLRPSRLPDLATNDGCCRCAGAQARGRV